MPEYNSAPQIDVRWSRRRLIQLGAAASALPFLAACSIGRRPEATQPLSAAGTARAESPRVSAEAATSTPIPAPTLTPTSSPTPTPPPAELLVYLDPPQVGVGEAMRVRATYPGAASGTVRFRGVDVPMIASAPGTLWTVVGAAVDDTTRPTTLSVTARNAGGGLLSSSTVQTAIVPVERPVDYLVATAETVSVLTYDAAVIEDRLRAQQLATNDAAPHWSGLFIRPCAGDITTAFGQGRSINGGPVTGQHTGVDLANDEGTPIALAAAGRVIFAGFQPIRGNSVVVDHGSGVKSGYHHLSAISVQPGDDVIAAGTIVGAMGMTGFATGPHLHWEVRVWGVNVDPMTWLTTTFAA